jgi:hypothetical protein
VIVDGDGREYTPEEAVDAVVEMYVGARKTCRVLLGEVAQKVHCDDWPGTCQEWLFITNCLLYHCHSENDEFWKAR